MAETREKNSKRVDDLKKALESGGRVLPNNFEAEQAVLGCAINDPEICLNIIGSLEEIDFYNETHKNIFKAIKELQKNSITVDFVSISDYLENKGLSSSTGGISYITSLMNIVPSAAGYSHYVEIVKRDSVLRQVILTCGDTITKAYDKEADQGILGAAEKALSEIAEKGQRGTLENIEVPLQNVINKIEFIVKLVEG